MGDSIESHDPRRLSRLLNPFSKSARKDNSYTQTSTQKVYWPKDLVPKIIPDARVLTFGYDTHIRHVFGPPGSKSTVYDISWDFLIALEAQRHGASSRPILFIAHSLGGIVVKELLRRASRCEHAQNYLNSVFDSTSGIMFFGTPHGGADPRGFLQKVAQNMAKGFGFQVNEQIVSTLLPSSERLKELMDEFPPLALNRDWAIHSFQEQLGLKALNGKKVKRFYIISSEKVAYQVYRIITGCSRYFFLS